VEIHLRSSGWYLHQHQTDHRYRQVILHVVFENDLPPDDPLLEQMHCLVLKGRVPGILLSRYQQLMMQKSRIPCAPALKDIDAFTWEHWKERLLVERLEQKTTQIREWLLQNRHNWEEAFYRLMARHFGMKVNDAAFEELARVTPLKILDRCRSGLLQTEALLFGQAGLLDGKFKDDYPQHLQKEYIFLQKKYTLRGISAHRWKWLRLRPANFPAIRIAQLAALMHRSSRLFSKVTETGSLPDILLMLDAAVSPYWKDHYRFDIPASSRLSHTGTHFLYHLAINVICPMLFWYGRERSLPYLEERSVSWLLQIPPENNAVIREWRSCHIIPAHAADTQSVTQLYQHYCSEKRCLHCAIGNRILRPE
jgi:hypothetical protein